MKYSPIQKSMSSKSRKKNIRNSDIKYTIRKEQMGGAAADPSIATSVAVAIATSLKMSEIYFNFYIRNALHSNPMPEIDMSLQQILETHLPVFDGFIKGNVSDSTLSVLNKKTKINIPLDDFPDLLNHWLIIADHQLYKIRKTKAFEVSSTDQYEYLNPIGFLVRNSSMKNVCENLQQKYNDDIEEKNWKTKIKQKLTAPTELSTELSAVAPFKKNQLFVQKKVIQNNSKVCILGDIHSYMHGLIYTLKELKDKGFFERTGSEVSTTGSAGAASAASAASAAGTADEETELKNTRLRLKKNHYIIFLGDLFDRGIMGMEVLYMVLKLKDINFDQVFIINGNHEDENIYTNYGGLHEMNGQFEKDTFEKIRTLLYHLPSALFLQFEGQSKWYQLCHGGIEENYGYKDRNNKLKDFLEDSNVQFDSVNADINGSGFKWSDFDQSVDTPKPVPNPARGGRDIKTYGPKHVKNYLDKNKLITIISGHQDHTPLAFLLPFDQTSGRTVQLLEDDFVYNRNVTETLTLKKNNIEYDSNLPYQKTIQCKDARKFLALVMSSAAYKINNAYRYVYRLAYRRVYADNPTKFNTFFPYTYLILSNINDELIIQKNKEECAKKEACIAEARRIAAAEAAVAAAADTEAAAAAAAEAADEPESEWEFVVESDEILAAEVVNPGFLQMAQRRLSIWGGGGTNLKYTQIYDNYKKIIN